MPFSSLAQSTTELTTNTDAATQAGATFSLTEDAITTVDVEARAMHSDGTKGKVFNVRRHFKNTNGTVTALAQRNLIPPAELGDPLAVSVAIENTGTTGRVDVVGLDAVGVNWRVDCQVVTLEAAAGAWALLADMDASGLWTADFGGGTWSGTASAGDSGGRDLLEYNDVAVGTTVDGAVPARYNPNQATPACHYGPANQDLWSATGGTTVQLAKPHAAAANASSTESNPGLFACPSGIFQGGFSDAGYRVSVYDYAANPAGYKEAPAVAATEDAYHVFAARFTSTAVQASVDGSSFASASTASGPPTLSSGAIWIGANYGGPSGLVVDADILCTITFARAITDAELATAITILKGLFPTATAGI